MSITILRPALAGPVGGGMPAWRPSRPDRPFPIANPGRLFLGAGAAYVAVQAIRYYTEPGMITGPYVPGYKITQICSATPGWLSVPIGSGSRQGTIPSCGNAVNTTAIPHANWSSRSASYYTVQAYAPGQFNTGIADLPRVEYTRIGTFGETPTTNTEPLVSHTYMAVPTVIPTRMNANLQRIIPASMPYIPAPIRGTADATYPSVEDQVGSYPEAWKWTGRAISVPRPSSPGRPGTANPAQPFIPRPPRGREKEAKVKQLLPKLKIVRFGQALYRALDKVSESAEVVDALYDALPDDVKKRWSKGRKKRGAVDNFGQYGIDGADWKAQALWHNWDKLDAVEAIKNIVKNQLEDTIIGNINARLPKQVGNAFTREIAGGKQLAPEQWVSKKVDELFDALYGE